jgi:hypothetical protein
LIPPLRGVPIGMIRYTAENMVLEIDDFSTLTSVDIVGSNGLRHA